MAYYRGDYYRGDYYRGRSAGDPFLGALWGGIVNVARGFIGLPARVGATAAATATQGVASGVRGAIQSANQAAIGSLPAVIPRAPGGLIPSAAAAASGMMRAVPGMVSRVARSPLSKNVAAMVAAGMLVEVGGRLFFPDGRPFRRRRRMDYCNVRALRRGMRRVEGFAHIAKRTITFTKRVRMKKTRRRRAA